MSAVSAWGEKLPMFVIGKSKTPQCFMNVKQLRCWCRNQQEIWMCGKNFKEWMENLDRTFRIQGKKVALFVNNYPAHRHIENVRNINLIFVPPNTTSTLQSMDQGVIHSIKVHNRRRIVRLCIETFDNNKPQIPR